MTSRRPLCRRSCWPDVLRGAGGLVEPAEVLRQVAEPSAGHSRAERAALALAEEGTCIADAATGVSDGAWQAARKHFDESSWRRWSP